MRATRADRPEAWMPEVVAAREAIVSACRGLLRYSESQEIPGHLILDRDDKAVLMLWGPGLIPEADQPYANDAQKWFDANRSDPMPRCWCGEPSHIENNRGGACSKAHVLPPEERPTGREDHGDA